MVQRLNQALRSGSDVEFTDCFSPAVGPQTAAASLVSNLRQLTQVSFVAAESAVEVAWATGCGRSHHRLAVGWDPASGKVERLDPVGGEPCWLRGRLRVTRSGAVCLLAVGDQADWLALGEQALGLVRGRRLGPLAAEWPGCLDLIVPADNAGLGRLTGLSAAAAAGVSAAAFVDGAAADAIRVAVNPLFADVSPNERLATLVHEVVHVATQSPRRAAPSWVTEGFAEATAIALVPGRRKTRDALVRAATTDRLPESPPTDSAFATDDPGRLREQYALASVAIDAIVGELGGARSAEAVAALSGVGVGAPTPAQLNGWYRAELARIVGG